MPHVHNIDCRVRGRRASLSYWVKRNGGSVPLVHQLDGHSCGFLAAWVAARCYYPEVTVREVLETMPKGYLPSPMHGLSEHGMRVTLRRLGIDAPTKQRLGWRRVLESVKEGNPIIICVWPDDWDVNHWTVLYAVRERSKKVLLSNCYMYDLAPDGTMPWKQLASILYPHGEGMVCRQR